jgi:hypothetical protein
LLLLLLLLFNAVPVDEFDSAWRCGDAAEVAASAAAAAAECCGVSAAALVGVPGADRLARGVPLTGVMMKREEREERRVCVRTQQQATNNEMLITSKRIEQVTLSVWI